MKRFFAILTVLALSLALMNGCLAEEESALGLLSPQGVSEDELNENLKDILFNVLPFSGYRFFDTFNSMITALNSGTIAGIETDEYVAGYIFSHLDGFASYTTDALPEYHVGYSMLLRDEDTELRDRISGAIADMKADGTLDSLKALYIDDCIAGKEPEAMVPEQIDGAETLVVAVTGDRPPMDYFSADGTPIGFNTALAIGVAGRLGMNVEFVSVDSGARAIALASKSADVVFWSVLGDFNNWEKASEEDQPENTILTEPYLTGIECYVVREDSPMAAD